MFISQFSAFNYRSLKQVQIKLSRGKNVIVGKNNSGKSNIVKGIEILVGEKYPSYLHFSDNDFYTYEEVNEDTGEIIEVVAENFYIEATLGGRDINEDLLLSIKKQTAFYKLKSPKALYYAEGGEVVINYELFQNMDDLDNRQETEYINPNAPKPRKSDWKTPQQLIEFIRSAQTLKVFFCRSRLDEEKTGFGIILKDVEGTYWITGYLSKKLRDGLLTTTVISALRSHKDELRLVHYTWFGKLIAGIWNKNKILVDQESGKSYENLIKESAAFVKGHVDSLFSKDTISIRKLLEGAIAHKAISFKLLDDGKNELYKNVQVFVNDGIDRPIHEKGTGIQSAVIIALFSLYCNEFHSNSSLLIAEEPELYLHPQARRVISAELNKFLNGSKTQERQLIISTHSTEYLKNVDPINITRVYKDEMGNCSVAKQLDLATNNLISLELKRFLWANNSELFFADKVLLVEGGEVFLIPSLVDKINGTEQLLDYENISVVRVNGKGSFLIYLKMLKCFGISSIILGDLDCFKDEVRKLVTYLNIPDLLEQVMMVKQILNEMEVNYAAISKRLKDIPDNYDVKQLYELFESFQSGKVKVDDPILLNTLQFVQSRYTKGNGEKEIREKYGSENFNKLLQNLRQIGIFIWSKGQLEDYYTDTTSQLSGSKDMKALQLSYIMQDTKSKMVHYMNYIDEIKELSKLILKKEKE